MPGGGIDAVGGGAGHGEFRVERLQPFQQLGAGELVGVALLRETGQAGRDALSEKRVTVGSSMALERPCGTWKCAPIGRDMPCTSATEALQKAMPACVAPSIIASRAAALAGS